ncbi:MAG: hypothetical protein FJX80_04070 [Bacteroidetes bacterium]|nr:hypothetical protein [Bacteroidota bacterium]
MKYFYLFALALISISCGVKVPYTTQLRDEFGLDTEEKMGRVQFFVSGTIYLDEEKRNESQNTTQNGTLISSSSSNKESVIIPINTKCIFEGFGNKGELLVRFETGDGKVIPFATREGGASTGKRFFFSPETNSSGSYMKYGSGQYKVRTAVTTDARNVHLLVIKRRLDRSKRKERVVKGMKV